MKKFYISPKEDFSEIGRYARRFYQQILAEKGYIHIDSKDSIINILSTISSKDHTHIEVGLSQKKEIDILLTMLKANYRNVSVTLHNAPFIKHPFFEFKNPLFNNISKIINKYTNSFGAPNALVKKIKSIFVLSEKETDLVKKKYGVENVYYLPVTEEETKLPGTKKETYSNFSLDHHSKEIIKTIID